MLSGLIIAGILSAIGFVLIMSKFSKKVLHRILGYDWMFDLFITLTFMAFMAGTFSGAMTGIISGICMSIVLWITKHIIGYEKLVKADDDNLTWKFFPGTWTMERIGKAAHSLLIQILYGIGEFVRGWHRN